MESLEEYAKEIGKATFCENVLSHFVRAVKMQCSTKEEVDALYKMWCSSKGAQSKLKVVTS